MRERVALGPDYDITQCLNSPQAEPINTVHIVMHNFESKLRTINAKSIREGDRLLLPNRDITTRVIAIEHTDDSDGDVTVYTGYGVHRFWSDDKVKVMR